VPTVPKPMTATPQVFMVPSGKAWAETVAKIRPEGDIFKEKANSGAGCQPPLGAATGH
jgi:hypothetical protein